MKTNYDYNKNKWNIDFANYLSQHDVVFSSPVCDPSYGIPLGDGDRGYLLHFSENCLNIQVNKTDLWDEAKNGDDKYTSIEEENFTSLRHGGKIIIDFNAPVFELMYQKNFEARLSLYNAKADIKAETPFCKVNINAFASHENKVAVLDLNYTANEQMPLSVIMERWGSRTFSHHWVVARKLNTGLGGTASTADNNTLKICQKLNGTTFCLMLKIVSDENITGKNLHSRSSNLYFEDNKSHAFKMYITIETAKDIAEAERKAESNIFNAIKDSEKIFLNHCKAWQAFWEKSFVSIEDKYIENLWYLNLYYANSECRGTYPPHFCNGIWSFNHDFVPWNYYFHYNMQLHTLPLDAANHPELLDTYYTFKANQLEKSKAFCEECKGVKGALYADVYDKDGKNDKFLQHNCSCGAQVAIAMWRHYLITGDEIFLNKKAQPVILATAEFYKNSLVKKEDNLYHLFKTQAYEGTPLMDDCITDMAMIKALFAIIVKLQPQNKGYQEILQNLPEFHLLPLEDDEYDGDVFLHGIGKGEKAVSKCILAVGQDSGNGKWLRKTYGNPKRERYYGMPDTELTPVFPAGVVGLAEKGSTIFKALENQIKLHPQIIPFNNGHQEVLCMGWCLAPIYLARLGLAKELKIQLEQTASTWINYPQGFGTYGPYGSIMQDNIHRFKTAESTAIDGEKDSVTAEEKITISSWQYRHFDYETLPIIATAVNEMVMQSYDSIIRLFPAIDLAGHVMFKLAAEGGFIVQAELNNYEFIAEIESNSGNSCYVSLPEKMSLQHCYAGKKLAELPFKTTQIKNERVFEILFKKGEKIIISSNQLQDIILENHLKLERNQTVKKLGDSKLGVEKMY